ncbi:hypothetical protein [Micromonospora costi]|uniref:Uncharacterized protein n=1 Tax=Micromonospora costi TaxID=1530042 RepID=A0A3A9ZT74_9ACTN|nr:hypothetical protein [Micromonospora costi]RKN51439.1 hypothetical protein D7193_29185 [Micromonospora costi]
MTVGRFREVDHDLLADFVGGALDGTPEEADVARLVAEDDAWAEAYARLAPAVAAVEADLARWGEPSAEIPPAVADRITAALAALPPLDGGVTGPVPAGAVDPSSAETADGAESPDRPDADAAGSGTPRLPAQGGPGRRRPGDGVPRSEPGAPTGPGRRRRRVTRIAGPVALAAVSVAAVGLGVNYLVGGRHNGESTTAMDRPVNAPEAAGAAGPVRTVGPPAHSGTNYTPQSLAVTTMADRNDSAAPAAGDGVDTQDSRLPAPGGRDRLARLTDRAALTTCLDEIATEHHAGPLVVELVDYAAFQGEQALVIRFTDGTGARWAWVSGPECGVPGSGADTRYRTRVG